MSDFSDIHVPIQDDIPVVSAPPEAPPLEGTRGVSPPPGADQTVFQERQIGPGGVIMEAYHGPDYRPSEEKMAMKRQALAKAPQKKGEKVYVDQQYMDTADGFHTEVDYVPGSIAAKGQRIREAMIKQVAEKMYAEQQRERDRYKHALEYVENATEKQREKPDKKMSVAMNIVSKGEPWTMDECLKRARDNYYHRKS